MARLRGPSLEHRKNPSEVTLLLQRLFAGLSDRRALPMTHDEEDPREAGLVKDLAELEERIGRTTAAPASTTPPRRVAVAMALAMYSQPHLSVTFGPGRRDGTVRVRERVCYPGDAPLVLDVDGVERSLCLSQWELDDLREEIDRRAGGTLKQERALGWLWSHFGLEHSSPAALFRVLFPDQAAQANSVDLLRRSNRMYALIDHAPSRLPSLHLGWMHAEDEAWLPPLSFSSRYVDQGLRRGLARGIGAEPWEVDDLLDHMVVLLPREGVEAFLERDQWRVSGLSALTQLGDDYRGGQALIHAIEVEDLEWTRWLEVQDGAVVVDRNPQALFDELALERAQAMMVCVYAGLLARVEQAEMDAYGFEPEDVDLLDVPRHLRAVLTPLLDWARSSFTHAAIAARLRVEASAVQAALSELADQWESNLSTRWCGAPSAEIPNTVASRLLAHLVALRGALLRVSQREPDPRWEHRNTTLLFAAHYLREAPIERLWVKSLSDVLQDETGPVPPEDIVGCWFWPTWQRVLERIDP